MIKRYILLNEANTILEVANSEKECIDRFKAILTDEYADDINNKKVEKEYEESNIFKETESNIERIKKFAQAIYELTQTDTIESLEKHIENRGWQVKVISDRLDVFSDNPELRKSSVKSISID